MESFKKIELSIPDKKATYLLHGNGRIAIFRTRILVDYLSAPAFVSFIFLSALLKKRTNFFSSGNEKKNRAKKVAREKFASHELIPLVETSGNSFMLHTTLNYIIEH